VATIDIHQHLWPQPFVDTLSARTAPPYLHGGTLVTVEGAFPVDVAVHDPERRLADLDRDGIDVGVLSLQPTLGAEGLAPAERLELEEAWIAGARALVAEAGGRFAALAPWRSLDGFAGTSVGCSALLGTGLDPILVAADEREGVVFVHPEAAGSLPQGRPDWWGWTVGYTAQMQAAYLAWLAGGRERYPRVRLVFAMLAGGAPIHHERLVHRGVDVRSALDENVLFDTATYGRRALELCVETFGVERLVYGSDVPVVDPRPTLNAVRGFGESVTHLLLSRNPERILG
jgi:predicted TIM-barrel fold metal-dependent hydrolase